MQYSSIPYFFKFYFDLLKWMWFLNKYFDWGFQVHDIPLNRLCGFSLFMYVKSILHDIKYSPLTEIHFWWLCSCHKNQMKWKMHFIGKRKIYCSTHCKRAKIFSLHKYYVLMFCFSFRCIFWIFLLFFLNSFHCTLQ